MSPLLPLAHPPSLTFSLWQELASHRANVQALGVLLMAIVQLGLVSAVSANNEDLSEDCLYQVSCQAALAAPP